MVIYGLSGKAPCSRCITVYLNLPITILEIFGIRTGNSFRSESFGPYLYQSAIGTVKTSEVTFADARLLSISALIPVALLAPLIRKPAVKQSKSGAAVLLFVGVSFILWAVSVRLPALPDPD